MGASSPLKAEADAAARRSLKTEVEAGRKALAENGS
jgi:hypothetical protein